METIRMSRITNNKMMIAIMRDDDMELDDELQKGLISRRTASDGNCCTNINDIMFDGFKPILIFCARSGSPKCVKLLVEKYKVDIFKKWNGINALLVACEAYKTCRIRREKMEYSKVIHMLINYSVYDGSECNVTTINTNRTCLMYISSDQLLSDGFDDDRVDIIKSLIDHGANRDMRDVDWATATMLAEGNHDIVTRGKICDCLLEYRPGCSIVVKPVKSDNDLATSNDQSSEPVISEGSNVQSSKPVISEGPNAQSSESQPVIPDTPTVNTGNTANVNVGCGAHVESNNVDNHLTSDSDTAGNTVLSNVDTVGENATEGLKLNNSGNTVTSSGNVDTGDMGDIEMKQDNHQMKIKGLMDAIEVGRLELELLNIEWEKARMKALISGNKLDEIRNMVEISKLQSYGYV